MRFLNERRTSNKNKTAVDVNSKEEVRNNGGEFKQVMAPWLLPVLVAVAMLIFLAISFSLHHKRLVKHRRRTSQYYTLRYHRVAGPIFTCTTADLECGNNNEDDLEQNSTPSDLAKRASFSFKNKLGRYNTWSPRIFKHKIAAHIAHKKRQTSLRNQQNEILQIVDQLKNATEGDNQEVEMVSRLGSLLTGQPQLTNSELLSLADLTGLTRSYSCRARAVGVTTYTGTLAIAEHNEDNQVHVACDTAIVPSCNSNLASPFRTGNAALVSPTPDIDQQVTSPFEKMTSSCFSNSVMQQVDEDFVFNFDINDEMFTARSRKVSHANLPRYLEDDWTSPVAFVTKPCSHLARSISSYDETNEYPPGFSPKLPHLRNTVDSYGDVQSTTDDATSLSPISTLKYGHAADYNHEIDINDPFESFSNAANKTYPETASNISSPSQAELSPTTNLDMHPSAPTNLLNATIDVSVLHVYKEPRPSFKGHKGNNSDNKIKDKGGIEIKGNISTEEHLLTECTNLKQATNFTEGYHTILATHSKDDYDILKRDILKHPTVDKCYSNSSLPNNLSKESMKSLNIATGSEADAFENQPRNSSFKNIDDACCTYTLTPNKRQEEFSKCSSTDASSGKVDFRDPCKWALDATFNHTTTSNGNIKEYSTGIVTVQNSEGNAVKSHTVPSDHTLYGKSLKRSSIDMPTSNALEEEVARSNVVISLFDMDKVDITCGRRMCDIAGSFSETNIKSLPRVNRQRGTKGKQTDRSCNVFCESWEDGMDRDYIDKSLVSLHKFVVD